MPFDYDAYMLRLRAWSFADRVVTGILAVGLMTVFILIIT